MGEKSAQENRNKRTLAHTYFTCLGFIGYSFGNLFSFWKIRCFLAKELFTIGLFYDVFYKIYNLLYSFRVDSFNENTIIWNILFD